MDIYSITGARKRLEKLIKQVKYGKKIIAIGQHGNPEVFLVACDLTEKELHIAEMNSLSGSFDFLEEEPEMYFKDDLKKQYV